eukprot:1358157-Rhodomonas_salina.1
MAAASKKQSPTRHSSESMIPPLPSWMGGCVLLLYPILRNPSESRRTCPSRKRNSEREEKHKASALVFDPELLTLRLCAASCVVCARCGCAAACAL